MPSGPPELHAKWQSDTNAIRFLYDRGWRMTKSYTWIPPQEYGNSHFSEYEEDHEAIDYLQLEWDWGGIEIDEQNNPIS